jgi:hypothetical protein
MTTTERTDPIQWIEEKLIEECTRLQWRQMTFEDRISAIAAFGRDLHGAIEYIRKVKIKHGAHP